MYELAKEDMVGGAAEQLKLLAESFRRRRGDAACSTRMTVEALLGLQMLPFLLVAHHSVSAYCSTTVVRAHAIGVRGSANDICHGGNEYLARCALRLLSPWTTNNCIFCALRGHPTVFGRGILKKESFLSVAGTPYWL
jgi:hypothetical protein